MVGYVRWYGTVLSLPNPLAHRLLAGRGEIRREQAAVDRAISDPDLLPTRRLKS
jgi:hypothetical protein